MNSIIECRALAIMATVAVGFFAPTGCSMKAITVGQIAAVLVDADRTYDTETDIDLAAAAIPGTLKMIEGFHEADPEEPRLLLLLAKNYMSYSLGFIEDEAERFDDEDPDRAEALRERAFGLYMRASGYGLDLLALDEPDMARKLRAGKMPSEEELGALDEDSLPGLFWTAAPWAAAINMRRSDMAVVAHLPIAKRLLERCVQIDETYFWAGAHLGLGAIAAAIPAALGGDPKIARHHFDRGVSLTTGNHLLMRVLYASMVGKQEGNRKFFVETLNSVLHADTDVVPGLTLPNRLAHRRAQRYLAQVDDLFLD